MLNAIQNFYKGAVCAAIFGIYHQQHTFKMMELNNQMLEQKRKQNMERMEYIVAARAAASNK